MTKWTKVIYLAGAYRGESEYIVEENILLAREWAIKLWYYGFIVFCPHLNTYRFGGAYGLPDSVWLQGDIEILKRCDYLAVLPGLNTLCSSGTRKEIDTAIELNIPIFYLGIDKDLVQLRDYYRVHED